MSQDRIEERSLQLIEERVDHHPFSQQEWAVVKRMIHASADFGLLSETHFHPEAVSAGIRALKRGAPIITDTKMVKVGIAISRLRRFKTRVLCAISHPEVIQKARISGKTRASVAMHKLGPLLEGAIVAIGNAPTALVEVLDQVCLYSRMPSLIVGVPVGLVGAKESKERLLNGVVPFITVRGEKGGSALAVSIINALSLLALEESNE